MITVPSTVKKVDITVVYSSRNCTKLGGDDFCREYFDFYVHQSENQVVPNPLTNNTTYEKISEVTAPILGINARVRKTFSVEVKGKHIILAFHNQGSCSSIYSVVISYYVCPVYTIVRGLVSLPRSIPPINNSVPVQGSCATNAVYNQGTLRVDCQSDGVWNISSLKGRCVCRENMENDGGECKGIIMCNVR